MEGRLLNKKIVISIGILLMITGAVLLIGFYIEPPVVSPSQWNSQINLPEDVDPPKADRFQQYEPGDIVYIEGDIVSIEFLNSNNTLIRITDNSETCLFSTNKNFTNIDVGDHVFLKIKIIELETSGSSFILSGNDPLYFGEEAVLIDVEKEHSSFKAFFMLGGLSFLIIGILIVLFYLMMRNKINEDKTDLESMKD